MEAEEDEDEHTNTIQRTYDYDIFKFAKQKHDDFETFRNWRYEERGAGANGKDRNMIMKGRTYLSIINEKENKSRKA